MRRPIRRFLTVAAVTFGAAAMAVGPASAAPNWQAWVRPDDSVCGGTDNHSVSTKVIFQTCLVINHSNDTMQAVLLVRNNATVNITMTSSYVHSAWDVDPDAHCVEKVLPAGQLLACYGETSPYISGENVGWGGITYNGVSDKTPPAYQTMP
ncbi:hypothetical protein G9272_16175 [Streptomyces asoensis]|uniref:Secreted protein n=1 Tax=Streptomyces asoensis TaxID=249586 RepID=A0A6M4WND8_9ACTN|nr:hypothetical protein [Streptomyces asoensis]QJT01658.1 hypothetical protein G9272_16175 [Streptomyces asoensis]